MTRKLRPVEIDFEDELQEAIHELPVVQEDGTLTTVGELLRQARTALATANKAIQNNALIKVASEYVMKKGKRRGQGIITANLDGRVSLRITYGEGTAPEQAPKSKLPSLGLLRKRAEDLGVDISDLGRHKHRIIKRLDDKRKEVAGETPPQGADPGPSNTSSHVDLTLTKFERASR